MLRPHTCSSEQIPQGDDDQVPAPTCEVHVYTVGVRAGLAIEAPHGSSHTNNTLDVHCGTLVSQLLEVRGRNRGSFLLLVGEGDGELETVTLETIHPNSTRRRVDTVDSTHD